MLDKTTIDMIINGEINENMKEKEMAKFLKKKQTGCQRSRRVWMHMKETFWLVEPPVSRD